MGYPVKMAALVNTTCIFAHLHQNYNQNIEQPSVRNIRNQVEWKSDNYGIKATTSIQTCRKNGDEEWVGTTPTCGG